MSLRTGVLALSAIVGAGLLIAVPASRSFASGVASRIVHLHAAGTSGPIPFILDLRKHQPRQKALAPVHPRKGAIPHSDRATTPLPPATADGRR